MTDLTWWKKIISFIKKNEQKIVLIHKFHSNINAEIDDFFALAETKENVKEHLLSFDDTLTLEEIIKLKKQIFVNLNSKQIFDSTELKTYLRQEERRPRIIK